MQVTREAYRRGVMISAGTDHAAYGSEEERASLPEELQLLVDSVGMKPSEALLAATGNAARAIGRSAARLGSIAPGQTADLVLLTADPLADIRNIQRIEWVMLGGEILKDF
jgi:imidazolonepropionase-like amidohydrolase